MTCLLLILVVVAHTTFSKVITDDFVREWNSFKKEFNKNYDDPDEELSRVKIFLDTKQTIQEHNKKYENGEVSYAMGINKFSDWKPEEFNRLLGFKERKDSEIPTNLKYETYTPPSDYEEPDYVNWVKKGAVTSVKDQGHCGSSWAFSAVGSLEGQLFIKHKQLISLSPQNILDCRLKFGCEGGLPIDAYEYVEEKGLESDKDYPYVAHQQQCRFDKKLSKVNVTGHTIFAFRNEGDLRIAVATLGPVSTEIVANEKLKHYKGGVYDPPTCKTGGSHSVLVVGYNKKPKDGCKPYWLVKNSWGAKWGEKGYFRIAMGRNLCYLANFATQPVIV